MLLRLLGREEVVIGKAPCGECMGKILERGGNRFLSKYFARALSKELEENHLAEIEK